MLIPSPGPTVPLALPSGTSAMLGFSSELFDREIGAGYVFGVGAATVDHQASISVDCKENLAVPIAHRIHDDTHFMHLLDEFGRTFERVRMDIANRQAVWTTQQQAPWQYKFVPVVCDNAKLIPLRSPLAPGTTHHRVGFDPTCVFFFSAVNQDLPPATRTWAHYSIGWAAGDGQFATAGFSRNGQQPLARGLHRRSHCLVGLLSGGVTFSAQCALRRGGFDLYWDVAQAPSYYSYALVLDVPAELFHFEEGSPVQSFSRMPNNVILQSGGKSHPRVSADHRYHVGFVDAAGQYGCGFQDQDAVPVTNPHRFRKQDRAIHRRAHATETVLAGADTSLVGHQLVLDWYAAEPGVQWSGIALG